MSTLTVRIRENDKENLSAGAMRAGLIRLEDGEMRGNISALLTLLAQALPAKSPDEIQRF